MPNNYLSQLLVSQDDIKQTLKAPDTGYFKPRPELKIISYTIANFFLKNRHPRIVGIYGQFDTGKTILLWHAMTFTFKNHTREIYFIDADRTEAMALPAQKIVQNIMNLNDNPRMIVIDNIHRWHNWAQIINDLHAKFEKTFFLISGTNAILSQLNDTIAQHLYLLQLHPVHFPTYLNLKYSSELQEHKQVAQALQHALFDSQNLDELKQNIQAAAEPIKAYFGQIVSLMPKLNRFLNFHNLTSFLHFDDQDFALLRMARNFDGAFYKIMTQAGLSADALEQSRRLLHLIASEPQTHFNNYAQLLEIEQEQLEQTAETLTLHGFVNAVHPYVKGNSQLAQYGQRLFFYSPNVRMALLRHLQLHHNQNLTGLIYQDIIMQQLSQLFTGSIYYLPDEQENSAFVIDDFLAQPILIYLKGQKVQTADIKFRYKIELDPQSTLLEFSELTVHLPLAWFLVLSGLIL